MKQNVNNDVTKDSPTTPSPYVRTYIIKQRISFTFKFNVVIHFMIISPHKTPREL